MIASAAGSDEAIVSSSPRGNTNTGATESWSAGVWTADKATDVVTLDAGGSVGSGVETVGSFGPEVCPGAEPLEVSSDSSEFEGQSPGRVDSDSGVTTLSGLGLICGHSVWICWSNSVALGAAITRRLPWPRI